MLKFIASEYSQQTHINELESLKNTTPRTPQLNFWCRNLTFTSLEALLKYCSTRIPSPTSSKTIKRCWSDQCQALWQPWKNKNKTYHLQATKHHKNIKYNKSRIVTPSTPYDDQLSLVLALFVIPKYSNPSSIRSHLHPDLYLGFVHTEKNWHIFRLQGVNEMIGIECMGCLICNWIICL